MRPATWILICLPLAAAWSAPGTDLSGQSPYYANPAIIGLMSDVLFQVTYDNETMEPEMAAGPKGFVAAWPRYGVTPAKGEKIGSYGPGIVGQALQAGSGAGGYAVAGNMTIQTSGAVAFWVKPLDWKVNGDGNGQFFGCAPPAGCMGIERQAGNVDKDGKVLRQEGFFAWIAGDVKGSVGTGRLDNGHWYLVVFNWAWPTISISIDGKPFRTRSLSRIPTGLLDGITIFTLGSRGGAPALLDEVLVFNHCLDMTEVRLLHDTVTAWAAAHAPDAPAADATPPPRAPAE